MGPIPSALVLKTLYLWISTPQAAKRRPGVEFTSAPYRPSALLPRDEATEGWTALGA